MANVGKFVQLVQQVTAKRFVVPYSWTIGKEIDGHSIMVVNMAIVAVISRVVKQSNTNKRERTDGFVLTKVLGVMPNIEKDVSNIPGFIEQYVVGLVELLGRRSSKPVPEGWTETKKELRELISDLIRIIVEVVVALMNGSSDRHKASS